MQTIGERLEEARKRKGISIREAAEATKIRGDYLHRFEGNQFDIQLPEIYVRGFLRSYANYLKLPGDKIVADYKALGIADARAHRGLSRESYGRMDLSVSSAKAVDEPKAEPGTPPAEAKPVDNNPATFRPRGNGFQIDRDLALKAGLALVATIVLVLLGLWGFQTLSQRGGGTVPSVQEIVDGPITIIALDTVRIKVVQEFDERELFQGTLERGQSRQFNRQGPILLTADKLENIEIERDGRRQPTGFRGWRKVKIP